MNFATKWMLREPATVPVRGILKTVVLVGFVFLLGCSDNITLPTPQELAEFEKAGPIGPELDMDKLVRCRGSIQDYRIQKDDLLKITFPTALVQIPGSPVPYTAQYAYDISSRVDIDGNIILPVIESIHAEGLNLQELEAAIVKAFYPRYTSKLPSIVARVDQYHPCQVSITGAVKNPGVYELPGHRMTLVSAIMAAGGILENGAASIRIRQPGDTQDRTDPSTLLSATPAPEPTPEKTPPVSNLRLTFSQAGSSGEGVISIKDGPKLLYAEQLDVTNAQQRHAFYDRVSKAYPQLSGEYVSTRLYELAEVINPGSARSDLQAHKVQVPVNPEPKKNSAPSPAELGSQPLLLPVKGLNIPFSDIALTNGSVIEVEQINPQVFTVIGLVRRAGAFPYPPTARYTLLDALGFAGGVDEIIDPRYVRVYRRTADGRIVDSAFELKGFLPTSAAAMWIKPGDVIAVEQTQRTRTNLIMSQIFRMNFGAYINYNPNQ